MEQNNTQTMNLLVTIDKNYLEPLCVMLDSYGRVHENCQTNVYVANSALDDEDFRRIKEVTAYYSIAVHDIKITQHWFSDTPVLERLPEESFYRLMAFNYLPDDVLRCLYLDPDIYIQKPLTELYNIELGDNYIAASGHLHGAADAFNKARLGAFGQERYINSGVMLMNIEQIKKDFTPEIILESLKENIQKLLLGDQDLINILFGHKSIFVDEKIYNLDERTVRYNKKKFSLSDVRSQTAIIHYNGKYKPWLEGYRGVLDRFYPEVAQKGPAPTGRIKAQVKAIGRIIRMTGQQRLYLIGILLIILASIFSYATFGKEILKIISEPAVFRQWLDKFGAFDQIIFILIRAAQTVVKFIPAEPLEIASGYAWGTVLGMVYCLIGNMIGTVIILAFTKKLGLKFVETFLPIKNFKTLALFENTKKIYALLFFIYLIPGSPKDGMTYLVGLLPVKIVPYMIITGIARIPSVLSSTWCGASLARNDFVASAVIFGVTVILAVIGSICYSMYTKKREQK